MSKAKLFLPITKVDVAKRLVYGQATAEVIDKADEIMDYAGTKPLFEEWSGAISKATDGKSVGNVRAMHGKVAAGKLTDIAYDDANLAINVCAKIVDDNEWKKVEEGVYTGFSIGGEYERTWADEVHKGVTRYIARPSEISIVDNPCVPTAHFTMIKADGLETEVAFKAHGHEPTNDEIAAMATALAKVAGDARPIVDFMDEARAALVKGAVVEGVDTDEEIQCGGGPGSSVADQAENVRDHVEAAEDALEPVKPTDNEGQVEAEPAPALDGASKSDEPTDWGVDQVFQARADGSVFAKKADAVKHVDALRTVAEANGGALATALAEALEKAKGGGKKPDGDYGDVEYADPGLQADKKPRYPIDTPAHIRAAWSYINKPANAALYPDGAADKVKAKIIAAWKDKIDKSGPPSAKMMEAFDTPAAFDLLSALQAKSRDVQKGLYTVSSVANQLSYMGEILQGVVYEERWEHDSDSKLPQAAMDAFAALRTLLVEMIAEESAELIEGLAGKDGNANAEIILLEPAPGQIIELAAKAGALAKEDTALMEKVGARHSSKDQATIQAVHDRAQDLGATCDSGNCGKDAGGGSLAKVLAENAALAKQIDEALPLIKALGDTHAETLEKLSTADARIAALEAQPMPMPNVRVVSKADDNTILGGAIQADPVNAIAKLIDVIGVDELQKALLKRALSQPQRITS